jgi:uncharacterized RDD family membrane protein YckC
MPPPGGVSGPGQWSQSASPGFTPGGPPPAPGYQYGGPSGAPGAPPPEALAGFWIRLGAAVIDGIILNIIVNIITRLFGLESNIDPREAGAAGGISLIINLGYYTYLHASAAGQTIGNRICGIRIADADTGGSIPYSRALIRALMSIVSAIPLGLGYFWMLWQPQKQTWHDLVAKTLVVRTRYYPAPGPFGKPAS